MHDTFLLQKITNTVEELCTNNDIRLLKQVVVAVNPHSHVTEAVLREHLQSSQLCFIDANTSIIIQHEDIPDLTAILKVIEGDQVEIH